MSANHKSDFPITHLDSIRPKENSGYLDQNFERTFFETKMYYYETTRSGSLSIDRMYSTWIGKFRKNEELTINVLSIFLLYFNFYFVDFLQLAARVASLILIFRPSNIRKNFFKLKFQIDRFFTRKPRISPLFSLNNAQLH